MANTPSLTFQYRNSELQKAGSGQCSVKRKKQRKSDRPTKKKRGKNLTTPLNNWIKRVKIVVFWSVCITDTATNNQACLKIVVFKIILSTPYLHWRRIQQYNTHRFCFQYFPSQKMARKLVPRKQKLSHSWSYHNRKIAWNLKIN